ncbi:helix-turn-helix domain-containing protein [Halobacillus karajensis]|uniref:Anaerobic benzoate catabolism transcriptional regulator n=1 Tax=Halobacillus karajensis TaxID=195088 RepID=A0A024P865_9BACI|nr:XRE family transcriptional regulator [Halobacillus karajensis]CDQ20296.1 anaerobic benzoate catabolism transcriptional regulator [Halobacillus karajensis]CDQ25043.1 anaerobic benzoate catabolism transcriptional regulator [Halobacillus karajensis]CDQ28596.1 anaerobic benzoate catabolism transcriptional regulator [Halobacillus karajensis]
MSDYKVSEAGKITQQVGMTLRGIRKSQGMSLQELAERTDVSKLTLGKIERGEANPSLTVIWKIANGLSIPISALLAEKQEVVLSRKNEGNKVLSGNENFTLEPMFTNSGYGSLETHRAFLKPGGDYFAEAHQPGVIEYVTVMEGSVTVHIQEKTYELNTYDSIKFNADQRHGYINTSSLPAVLHFVMIYSNQI